MLSKETRLKTLAIGFTVISLMLFVYHQYGSYQKSITLTQQKLRLNSLRGQIRYLDEALTMSSRLYILTNDSLWLHRYRKLEPEYTAAIFQIDSLILGDYTGNKELKSASEQLFGLEKKAFELAALNKLAEAKSILFSESYKEQQKRYKVGLTKLSAGIAVEINALLLTQRADAIKAALVITGIVLLILFGWGQFLLLSKRWQNKITRARTQLADNAIASEKELNKTNNQLRLLSAYLQEEREKERKALAYEMHEELAQQIAAMKIKLALIEDSLTPDQQPQAVQLKQVTGQLGETVKYIRKLSTDMYPSILKDLGLAEALESESKRYASHSNVNVIFNNDVEYLEMDLNIANHVFRIFQEKLNTIVMNGASEIVCSIYIEEGRFLLNIYDDSKSDSANKNIAELAIEERLLSIKGTMETSNSVKEGNHFTVSIPYHVEQEPNLLLQ